MGPGVDTPGVDMLEPESLRWSSGRETTGAAGMGESILRIFDGATSTFDRLSDAEYSESDWMTPSRFRFLREPSLHSQIVVDFPRLRVPIATLRGEGRVAI